MQKSGPVTPDEGGDDPPLFCVAKRKKENKGKKRKYLKVETIKRLSPRSKCYYFSHSRVSRIQKFFLSANHGSQQSVTVSVSWPLHIEIHFAGPGSILSIFVCPQRIFLVVIILLKDPCHT